MKNPENCRNAFERWMREAPNFVEYPWLAKDADGYIYEVTQSRWEGYQEAYNQPLLDEMAGALQFLMEGVERFKSIDRDNMEFEGRLTCFQKEKAQAALARYNAIKETKPFYSDNPKLIEDM